MKKTTTMKRDTHFVVDMATNKVLASFPSVSKAKEFQIQQNILETSEIWDEWALFAVDAQDFDLAKLRPADTAKTLEIDIGKGYALSVKNDLEAGVSITLQKNGEFVQDLVVVERPKSELKDKNGNPIYLNGVTAFVWGNEKDEDFTHRITIPFSDADSRNEDGGSHRESRQTW